MSSRCSWCVSPYRQAAEEAVNGGTPVAQVCQTFGLSRDQWRHHKTHGTVAAGGPVSLATVRAELARTLKSTGGRPSIEGSDRRFKIPLSDTQLQALEEVAAEVSSPGFSPSPGQIASVLVSLGLRGIGKG